MAISKVTLNGVTIMDTTDATAVAGDILLDETAYIATGVKATGTYTPPSPSTQTKSVSYTPSESAQSDTVTADAGYDGLDTVNVSVGAISSSYVGSGVTRRTSSDLSASGNTVTAPAGYYESSASKAVASGTEGTPSATKGTVSSHSVSVTPSVTNTAGYISGGSHTGTAVTVSASELVSGDKSITANGTNIDVTNYATVSVAVPVGGCTVKTKTASTSSNATSISFTSLSAEPKAFSVMLDQQSSLGSTRYVIAVHYDGSTTYGTWGYSSSNTRYAYYSSSYFTWTYSGGTLTVSTNSSTNGGYFRSGYSYRLIYAY